MEVMIDGYGQKNYYVGGETFSESEMLTIYNDYCDTCQCYEWMIYDNDDDFLSSFGSRLELAQAISHNPDYDINDEYVTYERGIYLISGRLEDCMDDGFLDEIEKKLNGDDDDE